MLGVYESTHTASLLRLGDDMERQSGLARTFRAVDLDDTALRHAADAESDVEPERPGGDRRHSRYLAAAAELHDRALAEGAFDLRQSGIKRLLPIVGGFNQPQRRCGHCSAPKFKRLILGFGVMSLSGCPGRSGLRFRMCRRRW